PWRAADEFHSSHRLRFEGKALDRRRLVLRQIIMHDLAKAERHVGDEMGAGNHIQDRKLRNISQSMGKELKRCRAAPGPFERNILPAIAHKLANTRPAIDIRDDLEKEIRLAKFAQDRAVIQFLVLIPHASHGAEYRAEMQRTDKHFALVAQRGTRQFLRKPPNLAATRDRSLVVEIHRMNVDSLLAAEADRDHLAAFGEIAEAG